MKLHLGCGQRYLDGYINIDYPLENHTVQTQSVADEYAEIKKLQKPKNSIDEIRLHHVFEHFTRPEACALVSCWADWLKMDGILHIEVPDYTLTTLSILLSFFSKRRRYVGIRHLFGSQEAHWANHYEGYGKKHLCELMRINGFKIKQVKRNSWKGTYNLEVIAQKIEDLSLEEKKKKTKQFLDYFLLDVSEEPLLNIWMNLYSEQVELICPQ